MDGPASKSLKILCFGDSLTAGYSKMGRAHYPYSGFLGDFLARRFPSQNIIVDVSGLSGDEVTGHESMFLDRMKAQCAKAAAAEAPYDWVIVLGGTNDLAWFETAENIYEGLKLTWQVALDSGAKVLALSVIECGARIGGVAERRTQLNALIAKHEADRWYFMDLCAAIPYFSMDEALREEIWDDGVHLTEAGYKMMGDAIAVRMAELLTAEKKPSEVTLDSSSGS